MWLISLRAARLGRLAFVALWTLVFTGATRSTRVFFAGTLRAVVVRGVGRRTLVFDAAFFAGALAGEDFRAADFAAAAREVGFFRDGDFAVAM
jgi:hypothetical protein